MCFDVIGTQYISYQKYTFDVSAGRTAGRCRCDVTSHVTLTSSRQPAQLSGSADRPDTGQLTLCHRSAGTRRALGGTQTGTRRQLCWIISAERSEDEG